jgi:hypothetical protein
MPIALWLLLGLVGAAGAVALARGGAQQPLFSPRPLMVKPAVVQDVVVSPRYGIAIDMGPAYVSFPPRIPANVLAFAATKLLYAGPFDDQIPALIELANGPRDTAEQHRGTITNLMWRAIGVGVDGFPATSSHFNEQNLRFNAIAVAIQDTLNDTRGAPTDWVRGALPSPGHVPIADLSPPSQLLCYRYSQTVYAIGCDLWDEVWVQGHTTQQIFSGGNRLAVGASPEQCEALRESRIDVIGKLLARLASEPGFTENDLQIELASELLALAKQKIVSWPGGPASSPFVDWGFVIGALARMFVAASRGDVEEIAAVAKEAGGKSIEWSRRPPGENYGSADLAADLAAYADDLASRI